jgi:hypothetical protein
MSDFDLRTCFERFNAVCQQKFKRTYNFRALEKEYEQLRAGKRHLAARDVLKLFDSSKTPFHRYWQKPGEKELDQALARERVTLAPLAADGRVIVERLLGVLHSIGVTSLVLRFTHPDRFGIFSTPVASLLQIHRPSTVELYLAFCAELREWQQHFGLSSVADTETGLWTFYELTKGPEESSEADRARADFDRDIWVQRRRAAQVLRPFLQKYGALELARILAEENPKLAGKIAGEEYERLLHCAARRFYRGMKLGVKGAMEIFFRRLEEDGHIRLADTTLLRRTWETRNRAVHGERGLTEEEVEIMIETIERLCLPWDAPSG